MQDFCKSEADFCKMNFRSAGETRHLFLVLGSFSDFSDKIAYGDIAKVMSETKELCTEVPPRLPPGLSNGVQETVVSDSMRFSGTLLRLPPPWLTSPLALDDSFL